MDSPEDGLQSPRVAASGAASLPESEPGLEWLETMMLVRRRDTPAHGDDRAAGRPTAHREGIDVGSARALRPADELVAGGRSDECVLLLGHPRAIGVPEAAAALPVALGIALASDYLGSAGAVLCSIDAEEPDQGARAETVRLAMGWQLPLVLLDVVDRAPTDAGSTPAPASPVAPSPAPAPDRLTCDGGDVVDVEATVREALQAARSERRPVLVRATIDAGADPIERFAVRLAGQGVLTPADRRAIEARLAEIG